MNTAIWDAVFVGTALVDSIVAGFDPEPVSASGYRAESGSLNPGGEAVNGSITAARLGLKTRILCALGDDGAGRLTLDALRENQVDVGAVVTSPATPVSTLLVRSDGTRKSITNTAHRYNFHPERYLDRIFPCKIIVLGSLGRAPFNDADVVRTVLRRAKEEGCLILADTKMPNFNPISLSDLADCLPLIDYIFPNEDEAAYYSGRSTPEDMAAAFLDYGIKNAVVKLGAKGCLLKNAGETLRLDGVPVHAVDATGAGDCFLASFAAALLEGRNHLDALTFANTRAALSTTAVGATRVS